MPGISRKNKALLLCIIALLFIISVYITFTEYSFESDTALKETEQRKEAFALTEDDTVFNPGKTVTVIVYTDTDCPFCKAHKQTVNRLLENHQDIISVAYRYSFLPIYRKSIEEGIFLECVKINTQSLQAYDAFQSDLFDIETSTSYNKELLLEKAAKYADRTAVGQCVGSEAVRKHVLDIHQTGATHGIERLPHTLIFSDSSPIYELVGARSYDTLERLVLLAAHPAEQ